MPAKSEAHRGKEFILIVRLAARGEALIQGGAQYWDWNTFVNGRFDSPASFTRIGNSPPEFRQVGVGGQRGCREVQQPRGYHTATPPNLGDIGQVEVIFI